MRPRVAIGEFVTRRLISFRDRPGVWGSHETVEVLALMLLELEARELSPAKYEQNPRIALDEYIRELRRRSHDGSPVPLHITQSNEAFGPKLFDICQHVRAFVAQKATQLTILSRQSLDVRGSLKRAIFNVKSDVMGDWLKDPWGYPDLVDEEAVAHSALALSRTRRLGTPLAFDVPKQPGASRPALMLPPIDRVLYQAVVDDLSPLVLGKLSKRVFGNRLARKGGRGGFYNSNTREWSELYRSERRLGIKYRYTLKFDVRNFFESVPLERVWSGLPSAHATLLSQMCEHWRTKTARRGLPQRSLSSSVLAHSYLTPLDDLLDKMGLRWCRWMDDVSIFSDEYGVLARCLADVEALLVGLDLHLNSAKTSLVESAPDALPLRASGIDIEFDASRIGGPLFDLERLDMFASELLDDRRTLPSRSELSFLCRRVRLTRNLPLAQRIIEAGDSYPFAADIVARMARELKLGDQRDSWFLKYVREHVAASDWTVPAWGLLFVPGATPSGVDTFFADRVREAPEGGVVFPHAAARIAAVPEATDLLRMRSPDVHQSLEVRALRLAMAQSGRTDPFKNDSADDSLMAVAVKRVKDGARDWDFRSSVALA